MSRYRFFALAGSLLLTVPALADDEASGTPTGKRQHEPVTATQAQEEAEEAKGTRVRKTMQELKNNAQDSTPAMNKAELTEGIAKDAGLSKAEAERTSERLRHKDRSVEEKTNKSEAARAKKKQKPPQ